MTDRTGQGGGAVPASEGSVPFRPGRRLDTTVGSDCGGTGVEEMMRLADPGLGRMEGRCGVIH